MQTLSPSGVFIKSAQELTRMREAGAMLGEVLSLIAAQAKPGVRTEELDALAEREIRAKSCVPSFIGYGGGPGRQPFPATVCVSINEQVVHGFPSNRALKEGDIVGLDLGLIHEGFHADSAVTVGVGKISPEAQRLIDCTREALEHGISAARSGARIGDISAAIQAHIQPFGYGIVREYVGHGIGRSLHEDPQVPNFGEAGTGRVLRPGMTLALEPMVNLGGWKTRVLSDMWTVITADGSLSAHFEHTICITDGPAEVFTRRPGELGP
jgi:methionyl aminopeptidase